MSVLNDLVSQIEDKALRERIATEVEKMAKQKKFGLVFEEHLPECTPLWDIPVKKGSKVALRAGSVSDFYTVLKIEDGIATCLNKDKSETAEFNVDELVSVAEFGEPIYPYLKPIDTSCNAPDSDLWHTLIEADNYHALQLLEYLYSGKVDCIYIDPPYNTGARDWKYNNDYVDCNDQYRHSKWLSMMQKRLRLAKKLLNPKNSALIVTIDEKEYLHLGCLLEEMFPEAKMQMISSNIHHGGSNRLGEFSRTNEFIFFLRFGSATIAREVSNETEMIPWRGFSRGNWRRKERPNLFYPIYINRRTGAIDMIGDSMPLSLNRQNVPEVNGCDVVFPLTKDDEETIWCLSPESAKGLYKKGFLKVSSKIVRGEKKYALSYLTDGIIKDLETGEAIIDGYDSNGFVIAHYPRGKEIIPATQWNRETHDATVYGSTILKSIIGNRFNFPKSVYAVCDCIRFFVLNKPDALVLDFFAGSGTTLHAVNLLNAEDGGHRRCIIVTNNEVSEDEAKNLSSQGYKPGDEEWERLGIARYVAWPRTVCSIEGHDVNGNPLKGNYIGSDIPMADGFKANAAYFKLGFLDKNAVTLGRQFKEMLPTLWMKSGAKGPCPSIGDEIPDMLILPENRFAVLLDEKQYMYFANQIEEHPEIEAVFIVTDSESGYRDMISGLNVKESFQLYRDYLDNFRIYGARR